MTRGLIFWVLMLIWFVFGALNLSGAAGAYSHAVLIGSTLLDFILFLLLGWAVYGAPVKG
jgi:hypothetical protein